MEHVPVDESQAWLAERLWSLSGNRVLTTDGHGALSEAQVAHRICRPRSAEEIASLICSLPVTTPIACVGGGHESSNVAPFASADAVILDMIQLKSIAFHEDDEVLLVTVGAGVVFQELVEAVRDRQGALPVGTGPDVGVVGYIVNGGLSGYFSRRLGLLGQRVVALTMVTAAGEVRVLTAADDLFSAMLGAGSALGVVVDVTIRVDTESVVQGAEQRVFIFDTREQAVAFTRGAVRFMRDQTMPDDAVSMELVVTGTSALVVTLVFYDSFRGDMAQFVGPLEELAASLTLPTVMSSQWTSWYEAAAALWPVITEQKGDPLIMLQHCMGTRGIPADDIIDFVSDTIVAQAPLDDATMSLVEIRTLGGAALTGIPIPSGNCQHTFFVDIISLYDASGTTIEGRRAIADCTGRLVRAARKLDGLTVDFSGTHSQPDDADYRVVAADIFGTAEMAGAVKASKHEIDPHNRFRFHPFARLL